METVGPSERINRWMERHGLELTDEQAQHLVDQFLLAESEAASRMRESCINEALDFRTKVREKAEQSEKVGDREQAHQMAALAAAATILCEHVRRADLTFHREEGPVLDSWAVGTDGPEDPIPLGRVRLLKQLEEQEPLATAVVQWFYGGGTNILHTLHYEPPSHIERIDHHEWLVDHFEDVLLGLRLA